MTPFLPPEVPGREFGAIVLCGGQSRRMGRPKAWLPFGAETLLQRIVRIVAAEANPVVVVAATDQELPRLPESVKVVRDAVADRGPLQGLATGLAALPETVEFAFATATDAPFLQPKFIARLRERIARHDLAIPFANTYYHPLAALYRRSIALPAIETLLAEDRLRPIFLVHALKTLTMHAIDFRDVDPELKSLRNLNTVEDYHSALKAAGL